MKQDIKMEFIAHCREKDKTKQDLWEHLNEVSILTAQFTSELGLKKVGELIGLLHDLGKASSEFDRYIRSAAGLIDSDEDDYIDAKGNKGKIDHSSAGAQAIYLHFTKQNNEELLPIQILCLVIASHHSGLIDCLTPDGTDNFTKRMCKPDEKTHTAECISNLNTDIKQKIEKLIKDKSLINELNEKLINLKEENDSKETLLFKVGLLTKFIFSCLIDADRINTANFEFPENAEQRNQGDYISWSVLSSRLEIHLSEFECSNNVDLLRQEISRDCLDFSSKPKGLYQLTVPTGGGKTLSSLRFAINHAQKYKMDRIIYIIPYTSIIDQNAQTVREILEEKDKDGKFLNNVVLEHHSNLTPEEESSKQKLLAENWDAPIVFTTMVQFLEALFGYGTRSARRMHQLANAVIIFDEIQTIPVRCVHLFNLAVRFLVKSCGSTVVLCTATQPLLNKIKPEYRALPIKEDRQMVPNVEELFKKLKRVNVCNMIKAGGWTDLEVAGLTEQKLNETGSVLIIVNTKKSAANLYRQLQLPFGTKIYHLSTNMCPAHRLKVIDDVKKCLPNKNPVVCVSTQLIEAGVNIDFGTVIRYLAGLDSIAQAAGRCNRNGIRPVGDVLIVNPKDENLDKLADIRLGADKSLRVLDEYKSDPQRFDGDILSPAAMEQYYKYYFYERSDEMSYPIESKSKAGRNDNLFELLSTNKLSVEAYRRINKPALKIPLRQSFKTASEIFQAIDSSTRGIIVPYGEEGKRIINELCAAKHLKEQYSLLKEAQRYSVNVLAFMLDKLVEKKIVYETQEGSGIFYLDSQYYNEQFGMSTSKVNEMELLNV
ncbi:MAG: CRISPR-associated helicase Cas3' [Clostridiales bacterium]|nr:CRISPR-associated helicase Cas3' [Clostridiales bacterium]